MRAAVCVVGLLLAVGTGSSAVAQEESGTTEAAGDTREPARVRKLDLDIEIVSQGQIQKPQVQYFISREQIRDKTALDLEESFLPKVVDAVEEEPF